MINANDSIFNTYVWNMRTDLIGSGATCNVYKAKCTKSGNYYAVKVFTDGAKKRTTSLQLRELDLLSKINHENVVKLIDKKDEYTSDSSGGNGTSSKNGIILHKYSLHLIVMEYCNGGSLATVLEKPENMFGLQESEFLLVLKHLTDGMKTLHQNKITHRDIKPNNILLQVLPNGKHVYKLTDFGAAKQMSKEDETFESIVGTEEYLFPDVYERAFYRVDNPNSAKADIDLWSIGVTLYHVSTGQLPFRPYGGRQARDVMIKITKDKKSGMISGVQHIEGGPIEYDDKLPAATCQLSLNLQSQLIQMLAGLMENTFEQMWSFDKFFDYSSKITEKAYINILNVNKLQLFELSFEPYSTLVTLKKDIEKETKMSQGSQLLLYNNLYLHTIINENTRVIAYPLMDSKNPLILFSLTNEIRANITNIIKTTIPYLDLHVKKEERLKPTHISEATFWSRNLVASFYQLKREIYQYSSILDLLKSSAISLKSFIYNNKLKQENTIRQLSSTVNVLETKLSSFKKLFDFIKQLNRNTSQMQMNTDKNQMLKEMQQEIDMYEREIRAYERRIEEYPLYYEMLMRDTKIPSLKIHIDTICENAQLLFDEYLQERRELRTQYNRDVPLKNYGLIRRTQMYNLKDDAKELHTQITQHFSDFFNTYQKWLNDLLKLNDLLNKIEEKLVLAIGKLDTTKLQIDNDLSNKINLIIEFISNNNNNNNQQQQKQQQALNNKSNESNKSASSNANNNRFVVSASSNVNTSSSTSSNANANNLNNGIGFEDFVKSISAPDYLLTPPPPLPPSQQQQQQQQQVNDKQKNVSSSGDSPYTSSNGSNSANTNANIGFPENEIANSIVSNYNHIYSLVYNLNAIKGENNETSKVLNENENLLKYLHELITNVRIGQ